MTTSVRRREHDYEITVDGEHAGLAAFEDDDGVITVTHTEIDSAFEGRGIGSALAKAMLDDLRARGQHVVPVCPFTKAWIDRHPDYQDLLAR